MARTRDGPGRALRGTRCRRGWSARSRSWRAARSSTAASCPSRGGRAEPLPPQDGVTGEVKLFCQVEHPGLPAGAIRSRPEEDAFEMPELLSDREHLTGGQGAVAEEYRHAVARERGIGEDVNVLEVHASNCRTGARCPAVQARELTWHAASAPTRRSATNPGRARASLCAVPMWACW